MLAQQGPATPEQTLTATRLVVGGLLCGLLTFSGIVLVLDRGGNPSGDFMRPVAAVGLVLGVAVSLLAGHFMRTYYRRRKLSEADLLAAFFQTTLVRAAALEAPGFLCLITYMLSGHRLALAGTAVCIVLIVALFPTRAAWDGFHATVAGGGDRFEPR